MGKNWTKTQKCHIQCKTSTKIPVIKMWFLVHQYAQIPARTMRLNPALYSSSLRCAIIYPNLQPHETSLVCWPILASYLNTNTHTK